MKINLRSIICKIVIFYPMFYTLMNIFSDDCGRLLAQLFFVIVAFALVTTRTKSACLTVVGVLFIISVNGARFGTKYLINLDFYGFILLLLIFSLFTCQPYFSEMKAMLLKERLVRYAIYSYYFVILISILFFHGLKTTDTWGVNVPMLYGPFSLPHGLAYNQLAIYSMASVQLRKTQKKEFLFLMGLACLCTMWTGVRSAMLTLVLIVFIDYIEMKNTSTKYIITISGIIAFLYLAMFTDVLTHNPIIQKTIDALAHGTISNHREDFNSYLIGIFLNKTTIIDKLLGISLPQLRTFMYLRYGTELHAHNDILNILLGMGTITFMFYIKLFYSFSRICRKWYLLFVVIFILAFTNGLYMYVGFSPCLPSLAVLFDLLYKHHEN